MDLSGDGGVVHLAADLGDEAAQEGRVGGDGDLHLPPELLLERPRQHGALIVGPAARRPHPGRPRPRARPAPPPGHGPSPPAPSAAGVRVPARIIPASASTIEPRSLTRWFWMR